MTEVHQAAAICGRTIQFRWTEGPTKGTTHEHVFSEDGTVEWRDTTPGKERATGTPQKSVPSKENPEYAALRVADDIYAVSYLAPSGYTLTVVLNFQDRKLVGFASSAKEWYPVQGTFEIVK
jgi:hypothetical protein